MKKFFGFLCVFFISCNVLAAPTLDDFIKNRDLRSVAISPNGRYLAQVWEKDLLRMVTITDLEAPGKPIVGKLADKINRPDSVSWANNDRVLVHTLIPYDKDAVEHDSVKKKDFDIEDYFMFTRLISMDIHAKNIVMLMNDHSDLRANIHLSQIHHYLPKDSEHILMTAGREDVITLFKVNVFTGESEVIVKGGRLTYMFISDYDGNTRYRLDYLRIAKEVKIYEYISAEKWDLVDTIKLNEPDSENGFDVADLIGLYENNLVYRKKNEKTGYLELVLYKNKEKTFEVLASQQDKDILGPITDLRSNKIIGYTVDGDYLRYKFFKPEMQEFYEKLAKKLGDSNFYFSSYTENGDKAIVNMYGPDNPLSFGLYDLKKDDLTFIGNAYFNIATKNLSQTAMANYTARDGKKIHSYILLPAEYEQGKKYPLIVMPHGGPQARDRATYDDFAQFVSTRGYIVIQPNFRGSTGSGKEFEEAGYKQWGQLMQDDLTDAANFMVKKGYADPAKICIVGISYGGYAALMGAIKTPDIFKCSISINGVTNLRDMISYDEKKVNDESIMEKLWYSRIGNPTTDKAMLDEYSPALHADKVKTPILIIASAEDHIVPISQANDMLSALKKEKKDVGFVKVKDADHNPFNTNKNTKLVYGEVDKFLAKYLQH